MNMIVCLEKNTVNLLESQSFCKIETLQKNALNAGFTKDQIEIKEVTEEEYKQILNRQPKPNVQVTEQQKINAALLLQNAKISRELQDQKNLNAQVLLELANIKKGGM